ncbi:MAG: hypothetical protein MJZ92_00665 [Paludibacteraceae bacterium]|nr:hypothetical protein [Paludibacteraceae bacterium]
MKYNFTFANVGGATRVKIQSGEDIRHIGELDQKMWTVLSCPTTGLEIDEQSLKLMDTDGDGQLHVNEVIKNAEWLCSVLRDPQVLFKGQDSLAIADIQDEAIAEIAKQIAGDKEIITLADVDAAIAAVAIEPTQPELQVAEAPFEPDVMAAYNEKKADYAEYFKLEKLSKMGLAVIPEDTAKPGMAETEFLDMGAKIADYEAIVAANTAAETAAQEADAAALTAAQEVFVPLRKLLLLCRDFCLLLRNYITLEDFYEKGNHLKSIFQAGVLVIDQRACHLCIRVNDMAKQNAQAGASGMFLIYCDCTSKVLNKQMTIVAAMTMGEIRNLTVGKNAIFYDRQGYDYDAVVTKIIDNPISIRQAFWSPYRKFANWVTELINKSAAEKNDKAFADMTADVQAKVENPPAADPQAEQKKSAFDIAKFAGIFAAIGMAIGFIGSFLTSLAKGINAMSWWQLIAAIVGIMLVISGPAMIMAWIKLRKRNLAPLLNANGWAVNADSIVNVLFGATLTEMVQFPILKLDVKKGLATWKKWVISIAAAIVLVAGLWLGNLLNWCNMPSPLPYFHQEVVCEAAAEETVPAEEVVVEEVPAEAQGTEEVTE